ncbi:hypothetical protein [Brevifollis gellanilyticus]|nr:hypothetical protein [Brevifollis gellanilyticus]
MSTITEAGILSRVIQPDKGGWDKGVANAILGFAFSDADRERMNTLLEMAKTDALDADGRQELASFHKAGRMLELMKARARISLQQSAA